MAIKEVIREKETELNTTSIREPADVEIKTVHTAHGNVEAEQINPMTEKTSWLTGYRLLYYLLGVIEVILAARFTLKLLGANPESGFVGFIYTISGPLEFPFRGIFPEAVSTGAVVQSLFEPSTIVAMIVYAIIVWGIGKLLEIRETA